MTADIISLADRRDAEAARIAAHRQSEDETITFLLRRIARNLGVDISDIEAPATTVAILRRGRPPKGGGK